MKNVWILGLMILMNATAPSSAPARQTIALQGPYLGQTPPGLKPETFAPGIVSTPDALEIGCAWSPDGREFYFVRQGASGGVMLGCYWEAAGWTRPAEIDAFREHPGFEPFISADGRRFFYTRYAPPPALVGGWERLSEAEQREKIVNIWVRDKNGRTFGAPHWCAPGMFSTVAASGNLYLTQVAGEPKGIRVFRPVPGGWVEGPFLGGGINLPQSGAHPCVAPDESFMVFDSKRADDPENADLFVCFRQKDGSWGEAFPLGDSVNTRWNDICPALSPDGRFLFYMSKGDLYWVSAKVIEDRRPKEGR